MHTNAHSRRRRLTRRSRTGAGFTLIELLVVLAIIGLLTSVILATFHAAHARARDSIRGEDMHTIANGIALYSLEHEGVYPDETPGGAGCWWNWQSGNVTGGSDAWMDKLVAGGYIKTLPKEQSIPGCTYKYVHVTGYPSACGSGKGAYAILYWQSENPRPSNSVYEQPACMAGWGWGEAGSADPYGWLMIIPE